MEQIKCKVCGDVIEGFSKKDVEYRLYMHMGKHRNNAKKESDKRGAK